MAKMRPNHFYDDPSKNLNAEKEIFFNLKDECPDDWMVFHSFQLKAHETKMEGEIDFLVLVPNYGVLVLEVKGGVISCENGQWMSGENILKESPFAQASGNFNSLRELVDEAYQKYILTYALAFPDVSFTQSSPEIDAWRVYDERTKVATIDRFIISVLSKFEKDFCDKMKIQQLKKPAANETKSLSQLLRPNFEMAITRKRRNEQFERLFKAFTEEQYAIIDAASENEQIVIKGGAGTGKTVLAIQHARKEMSEERRVLLLCYNDALAEHLASQFDESETGIVVSGFHNFLKSHVSLQRPSYGEAAIDNYYKIELPTAFVNHYANDFECFDTLIIDEGQDLFRENYFYVLDAVLKGGLTEGRFAMFADFDGQSIYTEKDAEKMTELLHSFTKPMTLKLTKNCRNTREIAEFAKKHTGFAAKEFVAQSINGKKPGFSYYSDEHEAQQMIKKRIDEFVESGVSLRDIICLSPRSLENSVFQNCQLFELNDFRKSREMMSNKINFSTIQSFKGLDAKIVILTSFNQKQWNDKKLLYVGMTRAKFELVLVVEKSIRKIIAAEARK